jgi:rubrerythrin
MENTQPDIEVLELAIARELDAYKTYMAMSERVADSQMKEVLESLAKEELDHKARLELELMKLGVVVSSAEHADKKPAEDEFDEDVLEMDYKDMLLFAIRKERRSLRLYIDLAAVSKDKASREMLVSLAEDEAMHEARFEVEYNILMRKQK